MARTERRTFGKGGERAEGPSTGTRPRLFADAVALSHEAAQLASLDDLVQMAAVVLAEARAARELSGRIAAECYRLTDARAVVDALESQLLHTTSHALARRDEALDSFLLGSARRLGALVSAQCQSDRAELEARFASRRSTLEAAVVQKHAAILGAVQTFLVLGVFEVEDETLSFVASDQGYTGQVARQLGEGIEVLYDLPLEGTVWSRIRKVSDLAGRLSMPIGTARGWLARTLRADWCNVGDYAIEGVTLAGDVMQLELSRPRDDRGRIAIQLVRYNDGVTGEIWRPDAPGESVYYVPLTASAELGTLWHCLTEAARSAVSPRAQVSALTIDGASALDPAGAERLVDRLIAHYRPLAEQLVELGPALGESVVERRLGHGQRLQRTVSVARLVERVAALGEEERARLAPLGLDPRDHPERSVSALLTLPAGTEVPARRLVSA